MAQNTKFNSVIMMGNNIAHSIVIVTIAIQFVGLLETEVVHKEFEALQCMRIVSGPTLSCKDLIHYWLGAVPQVIMTPAQCPFAIYLLVLIITHIFSLLGL